MPLPEILQKEFKIIKGFWNAKAGSKNESQESVMGCCGYGTINEQGKKLIDIPGKCNFITHTSFEKRQLTSGHGRLQMNYIDRNMIYRILVDKR